MAQILVVDDEIGIRELLSEILADEGHQVLLADSASAARQLRETRRPDLVLLDIWMPDTDGISLLKEWVARGHLGVPVVMMSGHGTIETAVEATRIGAMDYLEKPIALQRLLDTVRRALRSAGVPGPQALSLLALGRSSVLVEVKRRLAQLAQSAAPLMLRGEPGMLGEPFARLLAAPGAPFLAETGLLAEASSQLLTRAAGGILFVPDLMQLDRAAQKSLGFILVRAHKHRARVVSFSTLGIRALAEKHELDPGLLARLSELVLKLPAVRDFGEDIPELAAVMLANLVEAQACPARRFAAPALEALRCYAWPGNLAELESVVRNLAFGALEEEVQLEDVERVLGAHAAPVPSAELGLDRPYREAREAFERMYFEHLLSSENGSMSRVAEKSGLERTHLYRKLKALGLPVGRRDDGVA